MTHCWDDRDRALLELLELLRDSGYRFITPTPNTHAIVLARQPNREAQSTEDVLGWSQAFRTGSIDAAVENLLERAEALETTGELKRATVRVSSLGRHLFLHSAYPTTAANSVFFGPDSYRFARFLTDQLGGVAGNSLVDIGTGSGVGAIVAAELMPSKRVAMTDINPLALRLARINAAAAGVNPSLHCGDVLADVAGELDIAVANPPYIIDSDRRAYRDGGGLHGAELSLRMTRVVLGRLAPGGRFLLYTGSAIIGGRDLLRGKAADAAAEAECSMDYNEIDPDVFGEELAKPQYAKVDRIAAVGAVFRRSDQYRS
ncbi:MAG: class I SAM-dependent methyltransferase [Sphingomicrobium sp.]